MGTDIDNLSADVHILFILEKIKVHKFIHSLRPQVSALSYDENSIHFYITNVVSYTNKCIMKINDHMNFRPLSLKLICSISFFKNGPSTVNISLLLPH